MKNEFKSRTIDFLISKLTHAIYLTNVFAHYDVTEACELTQFGSDRSHSVSIIFGWSYHCLTAGFGCHGDEAGCQGKLKLVCACSSMIDGNGSFI